MLSGGKLTIDPKKKMQDTKSLFMQQEKLFSEHQDSQLELLRSQFQAMGFSEQQQRDYIATYEQQFQLQRDQLNAQIKGVEIMPRKILKNILYLMVVNLPTEEELNAANLTMKKDEEDVSSQRNLVTMINVR